MSSKSKVTSDTRRRTLIGLAGLAASASAAKMAWGADPNPLRSRGPRSFSGSRGYPTTSSSSTWVEIHAPMARACPGIGRYALTIVESASTRKDVLPDRGGRHRRVVVQGPRPRSTHIKLAGHQTAARRWRNLHRPRNRFYNRGKSHHLTSPMTKTERLAARGVSQFSVRSEPRINELRAIFERLRTCTTGC